MLKPSARNEIIYILPFVGLAELNLVSARYKKTPQFLGVLLAKELRNLILPILYIETKHRQKHWYIQIQCTLTTDIA